MTVPAPESKVAGTSDVWPCALRWYQASLVIRLLTSREERGDMGGMMGTAGTAWAWIVLWIVLGVAVLVTGGVVAARALATRRDAASPPVRAGEPPGLPEARAALRMRYANGEISREDYLQGKVELED